MVVAVAMLGFTSATGAQEFRQTQTDDYTRYELQAPESHAFRIIYDVSATTPGARYYFNGVRAGAEEEVHAVYDLMSGDELPWEVIDGRTARQRGLLNANDDGRYIQVTLARPVPEGGQGRIRIDKTYIDANSYTGTGDEIVFDRSLGIRRNAVVLPLGYELTAVNYPSQIIAEDDGRIKVSFMSPGPAAVPYVVRGRKLSVPRPTPTSTPAVAEPTLETTATTLSASARVDYTFSERAFQDRDIVYFLQQPETHAFRLYHDYTESRPGMDRYINVVRAGSKASNPSAIILDTGERLRVETLRGNAITARGIDIGDTVTPETEIVVIWFDPVQPGHSVRLRIEETYTDSNRYLISGDELVWDRNFGRPRNTVILPEGWYLTANAIPAVVDETEDGLVRLRFVNDRPDGIQVFVKARRR